MQIWSSKFTTYLHLSQTLVNPFFRPVIYPEKRLLRRLLAFALVTAFHQFTGGFRQYNVCSYACFTYRHSPSSLLVCGGEINAQMGNISSPGYPNTPYFPEDQHDDNIRCHWKLRPPSGSYMMLTLENFFLGRKEWDHCRLVNSYNHGQMSWENLHL